MVDAELANTTVSNMVINADDLAIALERGVELLTPQDWLIDIGQPTPSIAAWKLGGAYYWCRLDRLKAEF